MAINQQYCHAGLRSGISYFRVQYVIPDSGLHSVLRMGDPASPVVGIPLLGEVRDDALYKRGIEGDFNMPVKKHEVIGGVFLNKKGHYGRTVEYPSVG